MRKTAIILFLFCAMSIFAQSKFYSDTLRTEQLIQSIDSVELENLMLEMLHQQSILLAERRDSVERQRIASDTTTLLPFHVGYVDSIKLAEDQRVINYHLSQLNILTSPSVWTKRYTLFSPSLADTLAFENSYAGSLKMSKIGNIYVPTKVYGEKTLESTTQLSTLEPERSLIRDVERGKKIDNKSTLRTGNWYKEATTLLQITQNYVTPNWYTGGSNSFAVLGIFGGKINYNDFDRITWENTLEWRAGASMNSADTIRKISTTEDVFKLYSKFNYKAYSKIYYSVSAELLTQFFDTYKGVNSTTLVTTFFTPLRFNLNLGLDFKPVKGLSLAVSPLSFKYVYVSDTVRVSQTSFSVPIGEKSLKEVGSSLRIEYVYKPVREFSLESKLYFYTNYKRVEVDLEVIANFIFNQYCSARINLHPRYDNTVILIGDEKARIQFKEFVSVGFSHRFR